MTSSKVAGEATGLARLGQNIVRDLNFLNQPAANWVPEHTGPDGKPVLDVLVVGAGMCGLVAAFQLRRIGITRTHVIDAAPAGLEGPWRTFARMETLRSPKHLSGPAAGLPHLTFRAWHEARFGAEAWAKLGYIPREMWADYLVWYGNVTQADVANGWRLETLTAAESRSGGKLWGASLAEPGGTRHVRYARVVVLATGRDALAAPRIPGPFQPFLGAGVDHTGHAPPREAMGGRDIAVIGLGASAFDYAAEALEAGARRVVILGRSRKLSRINKAKQIGYAGFLHGFPRLPDTEKLEILSYIFERGIAPPHGTVKRVMRHRNVELVLGASVANVSRTVDGRLSLGTAQARYDVDRVILGTGYRIDIAKAPFLRQISGSIRTFRDVVDGSSGAGELLDFPYLDDGFQFTAKSADVPLPLDRLACFNHAAMVALGNLANDIPAVSEGGDRLSRYIAGVLYLEDRGQHRTNLENYRDAELDGTEIPGLRDYWPAV